MRMPRDWKTFWALCAIGLLLLPPQGRGQPGLMLGAAPIMLVRGMVAGGAAGGIEFCLERPGESQVQELSYDEEEQQLVAQLSDGAQVSVELSLDELVGMAQVTNYHQNGCLSVSIDPIIDQTTGFVDPALEHAPNVALKLLRLDGEVARLFSESIRLSPKLAKELPAPADEARRLLDSQQGDRNYQNLARATPQPPISWHNTRFHIDPSLQSGRAVQMEVKPTAVLLTPDHRRIELDAEYQTVASRPYQALAERLSARPVEFVDVLPSLGAGLRYAQAFGILSSCERSAACRSSMPVLFQPERLAALDLSADEEEEEEDLAKSATKESEELRGELKYARLQQAWQEYRLSLAQQTLSPEVRTTIFVDETLMWYASLQQPFEESVGRPDPVKVLAFAEGLDLEKNPYAGWVWLGRFLAGTWAGHPLPQLARELTEARAWADREHDLALQFQILQATRNLLPLLRSNLYVAERTNTKTGLLEVRGEPDWKGPRQLGPRTYLDHIADGSDAALNAYLKAAETQLERRISTLFDAQGRVSVRSGDALDVLADFEKAHMVEHSERVGPRVFFQLAQVHFALGRALVEEQHPSQALNQVRLLESIAQRVHETPGFTESQRAQTALLIRTKAELLRRSMRE